MNPGVINRLRIPLLVLGMISLVVGTLAGVARLGWPVPELVLPQVQHHGILMVPAFFGTVIGLERAVALGRVWAYSAPLLSGLGGVLLVTGINTEFALLLLLAGSLVFLAASVAVVQIQKALHNWILLMGASGLVAGNFLMLLAFELKLSVLWWMVFLVVTIAGERLELSRLAIRSDRKRQLLAALCLVCFAGGIWASIAYMMGERIVALSVMAIAVWLILYDIARRTVHQQGLPRFTAVCMLSGYAWLIVCGILLLLINMNLVGITRDAPYHALFLGFVFAMVLGHALIIFPAVTRLKIPYSPLFYLPLLVLHVTLLLRVSGVLNSATILYTWGGLLNGIALALFIVTMLFSVGKGLRKGG